MLPKAKTMSSFRRRHSILPLPSHTIVQVHTHSCMQTHLQDRTSVHRGRPSPSSQGTLLYVYALSHFGRGRTLQCTWCRSAPSSQGGLEYVRSVGLSPFKVRSAWKLFTSALVVGASRGRTPCRGKFGYESAAVVGILTLAGLTRTFWNKGIPRAFAAYGEQSQDNS